MIIRPETSEDIPRISAITAAAFAPMPFSNDREPAVIEALRNGGELILSLVAEVDGELAGQITFSKVKIDGCHHGWFGLGPVAVHPDWQGQGIGGALIKAGIAKLCEMNAAGCALVGNPDYYGRFGFVNNCGLTYGGLDGRVVHKQVLAGPDKTGVLAFSERFERAAQG